ncbi:hypothetical protein RCL1_006101 [Eukaryota sp. TZLM3-RCL]
MSSLTNQEQLDIRRQVLEKLELSGEKAHLMEYLRSRLNECGFREKVKSHCQEIIHQKGLESVSVEELAEEVTHFARAAVPADIKEDLLNKLRSIMSE